MRLFLNLNNGIVTTAIHLSLAANAHARRGGREQVELQFHRDRVPERLPENWLILLGVKETGRYDAPAFLTQVSAWNRPDADDGFYTAWLPTDTGPINSLLRHDNEDTNDIPAVATMAQIDCRPDINTPPSKSQSFTLNFQSAVNNGDETPTAPETPFAALFRQKYLAVADATARLALTVEHVHNGDVVREIGRAEVTKITCLGSTYAALAQTTAIFCFDDSSGSMNEKSFLISTTTEEVYVWFSLIESPGYDPMSGDRGIRVDYNLSDSGYALAPLIAAALDADAAFSATFDGAGVSVTNTVAGPTIYGSLDVDSGFIISNPVVGAAPVHALEGKELVLLNGAGQRVNVGFSLAGNVGNIAVTLPASTQTAAQIAALMQPLIHDHADFSATVSGAEVTVTNAANGLVTDSSLASAHGPIQHPAPLAAPRHPHHQLTMHPLTAARIAAHNAPLQPAPPPAPLTDLADRLTVLFPGIDFVADVEIRDDGSGPRIAAWHRSEPQPTEDELRAVVVPLPDLVITDLQARLWLNAAGFYESAVQSLIDAIPDPVARENARAVWDRALTIHLSHPITQSLGAALGLDAAQLRAAFLAAAAL